MNQLQHRQQLTKMTPGKNPDPTSQTPLTNPSPHLKKSQEYQMEIRLALSAPAK
jgi:hypothetical protein